MDGDAELQRNTNTAALEKELRKAQRLLANAADLVIESPRKQGKALMDRLRGVIAEMLLLAVVVRPLATCREQILHLAFKRHAFPPTVVRVELPQSRSDDADRRGSGCQRFGFRLAAEEGAGVGRRRATASAGRDGAGHGRTASFEVGAKPTGTKP